MLVLSRNRQVLAVGEFQVLEFFADGCVDDPNAASIDEKFEEGCKLGFVFLNPFGLNGMLVVNEIFDT